MFIKVGGYAFGIISLTTSGITISVYPTFSISDKVKGTILQYARQLGAQAMARGARGSATQNILNSIAANRNANLQQAMTQEDARVRNILNALSGVEGNYFNMGNTMANNILSRALANQGALNTANIANTNAYNEWVSNLLGGGAKIGGAAIGALLA